HKFSEEETGLQKTIWHHGGSVNNYRNEIAVYPESDLGICVLLNNNSKLAKTLVPDLYKIVKEVYDQTTHKIALTGVSKTIPAL
ncbi:MAG: serine hydrolase, partial [Eudoraea sp.]